MDPSIVTWQTLKATPGIYTTNSEETENMTGDTTYNTGTGEHDLMVWGFSVAMD